jgi:hypothetical protein
VGGFNLRLLFGPLKLSLDKVKGSRILCWMAISYVNTRVYLEVSGLAAWSENCKWYSSLPLGACVSLFSKSV